MMRREGGRNFFARMMRCAMHAALLGGSGGNFGKLAALRLILVGFGRYLTVLVYTACA